MSLLAPWALVGLVLVPVVLLLQLLVRRAPRVIVSWIRHWEAVTHAAGRSARWRMRLKSPALWLELIILIFLVLSLSRPFVMGESAQGPVARLVVDRSATMGIPDRNGVSRWNSALEMLDGFVTDLPSGAEVEVLLVPAESTKGETARLRVDEVMGYLRKNRPLLEYGDLRWAIEQFGPRAGDAPLVLVTDLKPKFDLGEHVYVLASGGAEQKGVAITRAAARVEGKRWFALVALRNGPDRKREVVVRIDKPSWSTKVSLKPGQRWEEVVEMQGLPADAVRMEAETAGDNFRADNVAFLARGRSGRTRIALVGKNGSCLRRALLAIGEVVLVEAQSPEDVDLEDVDLTILVSTVPAKNWPGPACFVNPPADVGPIRVKGGQTEARESDWVVGEQNAGLGRWLYLPGPRIKSLQDADVAGSATVVVGTRERPAIVAWGEAEGGTGHVAVLFDISLPATDWPLLPGYPVFWSGVVSHLSSKANRASDVYITHRPYESVRYRRAGPDSSGTTMHASLAAPGFIRDGAGRIAGGVSFIGDEERKWLAGPAVDNGRGASVAAGAAMAKFAVSSRSELWPIFAIIAVVAAFLRLLWLK